ncbi:Peroxisomal acyl-coenzyme A oxidase 1 [Camellia lanceoleosa]|uniref:Peroxisomal acyl-coenzyme A oxidase 1 n=1 Tax=Camellia lanceoleosa TaxID=1840588 RepID=A0ACC0G002_9ERIC|nr:Peroxisomal acyl-coenzyme A oxidase 1 [Camellia lanceoleosa]
MKICFLARCGKKPVGTTSYMGQIEHLMQCRSNVQRAEDWLKPSAILEAFESRAARMFIEKLLQDIPGWGVREQLEALCNIYALFLLHKHQGDFLSTGYITAKQASLANDQLRSLYSQVRPNAIALVDAFNYTDHFLGSILGCYDGNVYPKLYEAAWKDPLNDSVVLEGYHEYIRLLLKQNLHTTRL